MATENKFPDPIRIWAGNPCVITYRIVGLDGTYLKQADVSSVSWTVVDIDSDNATISSGTPVVSSCIYDTLQTDQVWTTDTIGYNFKNTFLGTCFPTAGHRYLASITFVTASWGSITEKFPVETYNPLG